ncbi:MAG: M28 family peptidase [Balneolaceae bacterium]|nr:MAG: M28 family peptidase [Balneolaceae bacterium]
MHFLFIFFCTFLSEIFLPARDSLNIESLYGFHQSDVRKQFEFEQQLIQLHKPETYRKHLYNLTQHPHIAGTENSRLVIDYISEVMSRAGLQVNHYDYDAWMPQPGTASISLVRPIRMPLNNQEYIYDEDPYTSHPDLVHGWNAYSGSGDITADIVYANYGTKEDFELLEELGVEVEGKIVIARYGGNFRGFKVMFAEQAGAAGLIIYTDPANSGYVDGIVYPDGKFSDESTIQRGSLLTLDYYGDPLTPFEPALPLDGDKQIMRLDPSEVAFHSIPVAPLGYGSAKEILSRMEGEPVPREWQGGLPFTYRITGGSRLQVRLQVDQPHDFTRITNVIGTIKGSEYPDEWIILGSHHDAWGFGATDPNSGTAMLLTLAKSLGDKISRGWTPKRSIMIGHWDAEEFMLIGSSEWVMHLRDELNANAVLYLNADAAVTGPNFAASASPSLKKPIIEATKVVKHPDTGTTVYETWISPGNNEPSVGNLGGGSDHVGFYMHLGIPSAGISISGSVPVYHSNFDTFWYYQTHLDSTFSYGPALAGVYGVVTSRFANATILPYDLNRYTVDIADHFESLTIRSHELNRNIHFGELEIAGNLEKLANLTTTLEAIIPEFLAGRPDPDLIENINRRMIQLERSFLHDDGLPFSRWQQSLYSSTDPWSGYASWMIPGVRYILEDHRSDEELLYELQRFGEAIERLVQQLEGIITSIDNPE